MSSPKSSGGPIREGTRVVLREITASLHNSPPMQTSRRKSGNDSAALKPAEHEVKVRFAREFADVGSITNSVPESLSSASSFQSINSTFSTKSSSDICAYSSPSSPNQALNSSYVNTNIAGVEDLILGCAEIRLSSDDDNLNETFQNSQDLSHDQTFASAIDVSTSDLSADRTTEITFADLKSLEDSSIVHEAACPSINRQSDVQDRPILGTICIRESLHVATSPATKTDVVQATKAPEERPISPGACNGLNNSCHQIDGSHVNDVEEISLPRRCDTEEIDLNKVSFTFSEKIVDASPKEEERSTPENNSSEVRALSVNSVPSALNSTTFNSSLTEHADELSLPTIPTFSSLLNNTESTKLNGSDVPEIEDIAKSQITGSSTVNNYCCAVDTSSPQLSAQSTQSLAENTEQERSSQVQQVSQNLGDKVANDEQSSEGTFVLAPVTRPKSPEIKEDSAAVIREETENSDNVQHFPLYDGDSEIKIAPPKQEDKVQDIRLEDVGEASPGKEKSDNSDNPDAVIVAPEVETKELEEQSSDEKLDTTLTLNEVSLNFESVPEVEQYTEFQPTRQSTSLATLSIEQPNLEELKIAAEEVANDIFKSTLDYTEESDPFVSATSEIFQDPSSFDFLINHGGNTQTINRLRAESLYVKFDPLVGDTSMLPQGNTQPINTEENEKSETIPANICTPKRNPAIAAIDRLLFYSPISSTMTQKMDEPEEKMANNEQPPDEPKSDTPLITTIDMSKELELVRATVLELEEELEKQKKEYQAELEKQKVSYQEKINKVQAQMAQEVKSKSQMTVVVDEYEKSISRLLTERERDRTTFEQELKKVQEELQTTTVHLTNTEAAFNDVHQKYERLKGVVSAYKSNETVLKESIQENMETIKGLETRYDHLKNHAMAQLEKANFELEAIRKQHEDETVKLHALVRKAELKSNSLAELVEQKTKENKELAQILDEVIARVGHQNAD